MSAGEGRSSTCLPVSCELATRAAACDPKPGRSQSVWQDRKALHRRPGQQPCEDGQGIYTTCGVAAG